MTEEDQLLAAVLSDPDDDTVRAAYSDWLQEQKPNSFVAAEIRHGLDNREVEYPTTAFGHPACRCRGFVEVLSQPLAEVGRIGAEALRRWPLRRINVSDHSGLRFDIRRRQPAVEDGIRYGGDWLLRAVVEVPEQPERTLEFRLFGLPAVTPRRPPLRLQYEVADYDRVSFVRRFEANVERAVRELRQSPEWPFPPQRSFLSAWRAGAVVAIDSHYYDRNLRVGDLCVWDSGSGRIRRRLEGERVEAVVRNLDSPNLRCEVQIL